ncbi:hypothetical protein LTR17_027002 [Elasticomyces elasticus]|nr:hypothetical protein LTR17_027002 [Elasticomyces elasticus]
MPPKTYEGPELQFVVTTSPGQSNTAANRKRVRSQAPLQSWTERRKRNFEQLEDSRTGREAFRVVTPAVLSRPTSMAQALKQQAPAEPCPGTVIALQHLRLLPTPAASTSNMVMLHTPFRSENAEVMCQRRKTPNLPCGCWQCLPERHLAARHVARRVFVPQSRKKARNRTMQLEGDLAMIGPPSSPENAWRFTGMADPVDCYPVAYKPWFGDMSQEMLTASAQRGWPALKITRGQELACWEKLMCQHAVAEPALFHVCLLFLSSELIHMKILQPETSFLLRVAAFEAISVTLRDAKRASSDPLVLAVDRVALHENLYSDRNAANILHPPAQQCNTSMRGGMDKLSFWEAVKCSIRWSDMVTSQLGGTDHFLEDDEELQNFTMGRSA